MIARTLTPEQRHKMDAYWRAANYLSVGQIYLYDNPLLKEPLKPYSVENHKASLPPLQASPALMDVGNIT